MVFATATRVMRRRSSAISFSAVEGVEFGEIPIALGCYASFSSSSDNTSLNLARRNSSPGTPTTTDFTIDIGDYPMAILTRGATERDPVIKVAPHVHVIHRVKRERSRENLRASSCSSAFPSWALPPSSFPSIPECVASGSGGLGSGLGAYPSDEETTPKASVFDEAKLRLAMDASCSSSATMALARRAHIRRLSSEAASASSSSFLPIRTTRPLRIRQKRSAEGRENVPTPLITTISSSCRNSTFLPSLSPTEPYSPFTKLPVSAHDYHHPYASNISARRWSHATTTTAQIDWSIVESTLECGETKTATTTMTSEPAMMPEEVVINSANTHTPITNDSSHHRHHVGSRTPTQKPFTDRPLPPVPSIVVHEPMQPRAAKRRGLLLGGGGGGTGGRIQNELLPGCSGIEFD